jgi:hypothetical protein
MDTIEPTIGFHNSQTNETQIWRMNGHRVVGRNTVVDEKGQNIFVGLPFEIVGVGDVSGDGQAVIIWHNRMDNETQIWRMNGHRIVGRNTVVDEKGDKIFVGLPFGIVGAGSGNTLARRMRERLHQQYQDSGGHNGPLGFPTSEAQVSGNAATKRVSWWHSAGGADDCGWAHWDHEPGVEDTNRQSHVCGLDVSRGIEE